MKRTNKTLKTLFATILSVLIISSSFVFAANYDDPHETPAYPNVDAGNMYNYTYDVETHEGILTGEVTAEITSGAKSIYNPGDEVEITFTVKSLDGMGDKSDGSGGIKDILLYVYSDESDLLGSEVVRFPDYDKVLVTTTDDGDLLDLANGAQQAYTYLFKIPTSAVPGTTYKLFFQLYDYGMFYDYSEDSSQPSLVWQHAETDNGEIPFELAALPVTHTVSVSTSPAGVTASFAGTGTFPEGSEYSVSLVSYDSANWSFTGWSQATSGTLMSDVSIVANFSPRTVPPTTYEVTAVSQPAGVATFVGTGNGFTNGSNYKVYYNLLDDNYEFVEWIGASEGTINNANVALIAVFKEKEIVIPPTVVPEEPAEVPVEPILDEVVAQETPAELPATGGLPVEMFAGLGLALTALGVRVNKKNK